MMDATQKRQTLVVSPRWESRLMMKRVQDERAAGVKLRVDRLVEGYGSVGLNPRPGSVELNSRIARTEARRHAYFVQLMLGFGLSKATAQYGVLRDIYFAEGHYLSQSQIMYDQGVTSANVTRLIHGLEKAGLVKRDSNPEDKRSTFVHLTEAGLDLCNRLIPGIANHIDYVGTPFSDAELVVFNEFLSRLQSHLESSNPRDSQELFGNSRKLTVRGGN